MTQHPLKDKTFVHCMGKLHVFPSETTITVELKKYIYNLCLREFIFVFFKPMNLSNLLKLHFSGIKGAIPTALPCIERCSWQLHSSNNPILSLLVLGYFPVKLRLALTTSTLMTVLGIFQLLVFSRNWYHQKPENECFAIATSISIYWYP